MTRIRAGRLPKDKTFLLEITMHFFLMRIALNFEKNSEEFKNFPR